MISETENLAALNLETWKYKSSTTVMVPYRQERTEFFPQDFLVSIYCRLLEEKLVDIIFPGMNFTHLNQFVNYMSSPGHPVLFCFLKTETGITTTAGFGYITESNGKDGARNAGFGFGFFRDHWGTQEARTLSYFMLAWWIIELKIDVLLGSTLKANGLARNFSKNFGFTFVGDIPKLFFRHDELEDASLVVLEKENFLPIYEEWRKLNLDRR
jgi:hypothetical protein